MNKDQCTDREGINHFGEFGWYDGYIESCRNCRIGLDARVRGACESSDDCADACLQKLRGTKQNIISQNIANMANGEAQKKKEEEEDKAIQVAKREADKKKVADDKVKAEEEKKKKEEKTKNPPEKEEVVEPAKEEPESEEDRSITQVEKETTSEETKND